MTTLRTIQSTSSNNLRFAMKQADELLASKPNAKARKTATALRTLIADELAARVERDNFRGSAIWREGQQGQR